MSIHTTRTMTFAQQVAYCRPCFEAEETGADYFGWRMLPPNDDVTCRLTVNIGLE